MVFASEDGGCRRQVHGLLEEVLPVEAYSHVLYFDLQPPSQPLDVAVIVKCSFPEPPPARRKLAGGSSEKGPNTKYEWFVDHEIFRHLKFAQ